MHIVLSSCTGAAAHLRLVRGHGRATAVTTCGGQDFVGGAQNIVGLLLQTPWAVMEECIKINGWGYPS